MSHTHKKSFFCVGYTLRLINYAWSANSYLHIFLQTAKCCILQDEFKWFLCSVTVTLVSCPFFSRAMCPYFKTCIQNDMSHPVLMRCVGLLLDGKQLEAVAVLLFSCIASIYCHNIYTHSEWQSLHREMKENGLWWKDYSEDIYVWARILSTVD